MEEESYVVEEEETMEEVEYVEEKAMEEDRPLEPCPVCGSEIAEGENTLECDWCGQVLHEDCEHKQEICPTCNRFLPSAKQRALKADRRSTAVFIVVPFMIIEIIIAIYSWLSHPSAISVPDIDNWFSLGLIVNAILLIIAIVTMGATARRGEGLPKAKKGKSQKQDASQET
ncbi:MAG: hypothetical protein KAW09_00290 [Thermoplasmata archaeon]|nr:hypothetical protein [Thermoplasmata archaeon]